MKQFLKAATGLLALAVLVVVLVLTFGGQKNPTEPLPEVVELASPTASRPTIQPTKQPTKAAYPAPALAGAALASPYPPPPTVAPTSPPYPAPMLPTATATPAPGKWRAENIQIVGQKEFTVPDKLFKEGQSRFFRPVFSPDNRRLLVDFFPGEHFEVKSEQGVALRPVSQLWLIEAIDQPQVKMNRLVQVDARGGAWSPDGKQIAYLSVTPETQFDLWVMDAEGQNQRKLVKNVIGTRAKWLGNHNLLFVDNDSRLLHQVSLSSTISEPLLPIRVFGNGNFYSVSPSGKQVVVVNYSGQAQLFYLSRNSTFDLSSVTSEPIKMTDGRWAWSHDERYLAYFTTYGTLIILNTEERKVVHDWKVGDGVLAWSPDAESIMIQHLYREQTTLRIKNRDSDDNGRLLFTEEQTVLRITWSLDGQWLFLDRGREKPPTLLELKLIR